MKTIILVLAWLVLSCGEKPRSNGRSASDSDENKNVINYRALERDYRVDHHKYHFDLKSEHKNTLNINAHLNIDDFQIQYNLKKEESPYVILSTVSESGSMDTFEISYDESGSVYFSRVGGSQYSCSITRVDGEVTDLTGFCYTRIIVNLPKKDKTIIYHQGKLKTKRSFSMSRDEFKTTYSNEYFDEARLKVINNFLGFNKKFGASFDFKADDLDIVLQLMTYQDFDMRALKKLHGLVIERGELKAVIDKNFSIFDREQAYKICKIEGEVDARN